MAINKRFASEEYVNEGIIAARPDWNQNDETAADYIKNKPFGETTATLLPETTVTLADMGMGVPMAMIDSFNGAFEEGEIYTVIYNGVTYECTCTDGGLGNMSAFGGSDTGEPFMVGMNEGKLMVISFTTDTSATVRIVGKVITPIDSKFLPHRQTLDLTAFGAITEENPISQTLTDEEYPTLKNILENAYDKGVVEIVFDYNANHGNGTIVESSVVSKVAGSYNMKVLHPTASVMYLVDVAYVRNADNTAYELYAAIHELSYA